MVDLSAARTLLLATPAGSTPTETLPSTPSTPTVSQKITVGAYNGYVAIYTQGYEGRKLTARVAGKWLSVDPIALLPGKTYSLTKRFTGAGYSISVDVYIDGVKLSSTQLVTK
jgi:hypothetical protein